MDNEMNKVFEMMSKLNSDFKINEANATFNSTLGAQTQQQQTQAQYTPKTGDVKAYNKANNNAKSVTRVQSRIDNAAEFPEAFKVWFSNLGYSPDKSAVSIAKVTAAIRKVMTELGYK